MRINRTRNEEPLAQQCPSCLAAFKGMDVECATCGHERVYCSGECMYNDWILHSASCSRRCLPPWIDGKLFQGRLYSRLATSSETSKLLGQNDLVVLLGDIGKDTAVLRQHLDDRRLRLIGHFLYTNGRASGARKVDTAATPPYKSGGGEYKRSFFDSPSFSRSTPPPPPSSFSAPPAISMTPADILSAVKTSNTQLLDRMLRQSAPTVLACKDDFGYGPLHLACQSGNIAIVTSLLDSGANPDARNETGYTPCILATINGSAAIVNKLVEYGADLNIKDSEGNTGLEYALRNDDPVLTALYLESLTRPPAPRRAPVSFSQIKPPVTTTTTNSPAPKTTKKKPVKATPAQSLGSLFGDEDDLGDLFGSDKEEKDEEDKEEEPNMDMFDLFGDDDEPKPKIVKKRPAEPEEEDDDEEADLGMLFDQFDDVSDTEIIKRITIKGENAVTAKPTTTTTTTTTPIKTPAVSISTVSITTVTTAAATETPPGSEIEQLRAKVKQLQATLADKDRHIQMRDEKVSWLEDENYCRVCMENSINTVLLWCGHNTLCLDCAKAINAKSRTCPLCQKKIDRIVKTYRS